MLHPFPSGVSSQALLGATLVAYSGVKKVAQFSHWFFSRTRF
jgi:hypothetical protein